jgi:tetratricopeptide (TPR) repeat protein
VKRKLHYKAFISYKHDDESWARKIHRYLETYSIPRRLVGKQAQHGSIPKTLGPIFRDRDEMPSASDLSKVVRDALEASEYLIVICSPRAAASEWVNREVLTFKRLGGADRILCIIIDGEPGASEIPGSESEECLCPALRFHVDGRGELSDERAEPMAADARAGGDGYKLARLKLVAGLIGVGLDDLRQREVQRKFRRMSLITAASFAGMVMTLMLAWVAETARDDAERRREQADDLIGFMLGDLHEKLSEVGRLDALDSVAEKAMAYFAELEPNELTDEALANRSEALLQLGQVQMARGELEAARSPFEEALSATRELSTRAPENLDRLFGLGQAYFWVGYVYWELGELDVANNGMHEYYRVSKALYEADPDNVDYLTELGSSYTNLAILNDRMDKEGTALEYSENAVDLIRNAFERDRGNNTRQLALADTLSWSGSLLKNNWQFAPASERFDEYLALAKEALTKNPKDSQWQNHLMLSRRFAGEIALIMGQSDAALEHFVSGAQIAGQLVKFEPENNRWQIEHSLLVIAVAKEVLRRGEIEDGRQTILSAKTKVSSLLERHPESFDWRAIDARLDLIWAQLLYMRGNTAQVNELVSQVIASARKLIESEPEKKTTRILLANALIFSTIIQGYELAVQEKAAVLEEAIRALSSDLIDASQPTTLAAMVRTYAQAGDHVKAAELGSGLYGSGYRHPDFIEALEQATIQP